MTIAEAERIIDRFHDMDNPSADDEFLYIEAMDFLITKEKDPDMMLYLGGYYYEKKEFDLALKYYEMASAHGSERADECLGYIWYYGRTGEKDYEKAFKYYSKAMERGSLVCTYKVADMYRNGYYVEKDYDKYKSMIEGLYPRIKYARNLFDPLPEVFTRLAHIRAEEGRTKEAVDLYLKAKDFLAQRISYNAFFGNLSIMKWLIDDLYKLIEFDYEDFDFYDLYYVLNRPNRVTFFLGGKAHFIESSVEEGAVVVNFDGKWFRDRDEFFKNARIGDKRLTDIYDRIGGLSVE